MTTAADLPNLPYGENFAEFYDLLYSDKDYAGECDLIEGILREESRFPCKSILDAGCGTAGHGVILAKRGYRITGVDRMAGMLRTAQDKAARAGVPIDFRQADLRTLDLGMTCDAAIAMFAVLGFQVENLDLEASLRGVRRHVTSGGLFIFDVWHGDAVLAERPQKRTKIVQRDGLRLERVATPQMDTVRQTTTTLHHMTVKRIADQSIRAEIRELQTVRYHFSAELTRHLHDTGFDVVRCFDFPFYNKPPTERSWNLGVVARARS